MKTLVLGSNGQLGQALFATMPEGAELVGLDLPEMDISDPDAVLAACHRWGPDVVVNVAAYTAVDKAECEIELARAVNVEGPRNIAAAALSVGARLLHVSTDFVFDGRASTPYKPDAATNPLSIYGQTKLDGEIAVLGMISSACVVRTAWLYSKTGANFVKTMLRLMQERDELGVVADQRGTPTWADSLAGAIWAFAGRPEITGVYHWTDAGETSWYEFARAIQEDSLALGLLDKTVPIHPIETGAYPTAAKRPGYSVLDCSKTISALGLHPAPWRVNLRRMLEEMTC